MVVARAASDCDMMGGGTRDTALTQLATTSANDVSPSSRNARLSNRVTFSERRRLTSLAPTLRPRS